MDRRINFPLFWLAILIGIGLSLPLHAQAQESELCAETVTVQSGDTLSQLASRYLGSVQAYEAIVEATNAAAAADSRYTPIADPNVLSVGWVLCIPDAGASDAPAPAISTPRPAGTSTTEATSTRVDIAPEEHPLSIANLRSRDYAGSDIVIEQTLAPGSNYNRYVVSYESEGLTIYALLTVPRGETPETGWPVIVFNHGYIPPEIYRTTERYDAYVDRFARNGYIVIKPDYRGHGFSEGEASSGHGNPDYTVDVLNAVASIARYPDADPNRIGMWGHSMGGAITLRSMVVTDTIKAGVIWAGVVASYPDLLTRNELLGVPVPSWFAEWRDEFLALYGTPEENPDFWQAISPNSFLSDLSGPIQLHHATGDTSVPVQYSDVLADQIEDVEGAFEYYRYNGDNHNISVNFDTAMARSVAFFDEHVKNGG